MKYLFIVNGREDKVSARKDLKAQLDALEQAPEYEIYPTKSSGDACSYVEGCCKQLPDAELCFVACGGDGTICEVASGLARASQANPALTGKSMAVIAMGTGNDFIKYYPGRDFKSVKALLEAKASKIDIMKVNDRYSINVTNFGFDSVVGSTGSYLASKGVPSPYRFGIVAAILAGRFNRIDVEVDGEKIGGRRMLLCTLANCHYVGGEFFCAPRAKNDDGLIDVCYLKTMPLFGFLKILPVYTAGKHLDDPAFASKIIYRQAHKVTVSAPKPIQLCLDGEMYGGTRFDISIIPSAITIYIP